MSDFRQDFIRFAVEEQVLRFGEFVTKAGRLSPYFFNAGLFNHGASLFAGAFLRPGHPRQRRGIRHAVWPGLPGITWPAPRR